MPTELQNLRVEVAELRSLVKKLIPEVELLSAAIRGAGAVDELHTYIEHAGEPALWEEQ